MRDLETESALAVDTLARNRNLKPDFPNHISAKQPCNVAPQFSDLTSQVFVPGLQRRADLVTLIATTTKLRFRLRTVAQPTCSARNSRDGLRTSRFNEEGPHA